MNIVTAHLQREVPDWDYIAQSYHRRRKAGEALEPIDVYAYNYLRKKIVFNRSTLVR